MGCRGPGYVALRGLRREATFIIATMVREVKRKLTHQVANAHMPRFHPGLSYYGFQRPHGVRIGRSSQGPLKLTISPSIHPIRSSSMLPTLRSTLIQLSALLPSTSA